MITIRISAKTREQTIISADDTGAEKSQAAMDALATIMASWIFERRMEGGKDTDEAR